jgi:Protein of unknown function (DUF3617)
MSTKQFTLLCGLWAGFAALSAALAADTPQMNMKLGLWEITVQPQISGVPPLSDAQLQNIPPDKRAQIMAMMQSRMGGGPRVIKECITPEKQARGFNAAHSNAANCQSTVTTNTGSEFEVHNECTDNGRKMSITTHVQSDGANQMSGTVASVVTQGSQTMNISATMKGKWLGASCGDIKDVEVEQGASP